MIKPLPSVQVYGGIGRVGKEILLVQSQYSRLGFIKGHREEADVSDEAAAVREIWEESGFHARVIDKLGVFKRASIEANGQPVMKHFNMYLVHILTRDFSHESEERTVFVAPQLAIPHMYPEDGQFLAQHQAAILSGPSGTVNRYHGAES